MGQELPHCINFAPQVHYVLQAALAQFVAWTRRACSADRPADRRDRR